MTLQLQSERTLIRTTGGSRRHLVIRWQAPTLERPERRPPVRVGFALDRSGSMGGQKIQLAREALLAAIELLDDRDGFSIVAFDDRIETVCPFAAATATAKAAAKLAVASIEPRGNTNLFRGFLTACETISAPQGRPTDSIARCLLLTDGQANAEVTDATALAGHASALKARGIGLSTFGVGADFDEILLRAMADGGGGNFFFVEAPASIPAIVRRELAEVLMISQREVFVHLAVPHGVRAHLVGAQPVKRTGKNFEVSLGDLVSDEQIELVFSLAFEAGHPGDTHAVSVHLTDAKGPCARAQTLSWTYAVGAVNDTQPRDVIVDRLVALRHIDKARQKALHLNRQGQYKEAGALLADVAKHLHAYAGKDPVLLGLLTELQADAIKYASGMTEVERKSRHMTTSSRLRSKLETGSASRVSREEE